MEIISQNVFVGLPSLLKQDKLAKFSENWPSSLTLPPLKMKQSESFKIQVTNNLPTLNLSNLSNQEFTFTFNDDYSNNLMKCPHVQRKHYAKLMCNNCYHSQARPSKATQCIHRDSIMYAKGLCLKCYHRNYKRQKKLLQKGNKS